MPKFRSKPVVIEAWQYDGSWDSAREIAKLSSNMSWDSSSGFKIVTLEGTMLASPGDWIIKGTRGEFYPCKPDVFAEKYEPAPTKEK